MDFVISSVMNALNYRRDLPHRFPPNRAIFVTWRLEGSLPAPSAAEWSRLRALPPRDSLIRIEKILDAARFGPIWLREPRIAEIVCAAIEAGQDQFNRYDLHAYVVMSNHVHMLITPRCEVATIMGQLKGVTARRANLILGQTGRTFWRRESFDRWCRDEEHFLRVRNYIYLNPVRTGLARTPEEFPWGSAHRDKIRQLQ